MFESFLRTFDSETTKTCPDTFDRQSETPLWVGLAGVLKELSDLQDSWRTSVPELKKVSPIDETRQRRLFIKELSDGFFELACQLLDKVVFCQEQVDSCLRCGQDCKLRPTLLDDEEWIEIAGNTCTPWSHAGAQLGWLDRESLPALAWGYWLRQNLPDYILNECTPAWPSLEFFSRILPDLYRFAKIEVSPEDLGIPSRRPRSYTTAARCTTTSQLADHGRLFMPVVKRHLVMPPTDFFCAPQPVVDMCLQQLLTARGLHTADGTILSTVSWKTTLSFAERQRLQDYTKMYEKEMGSTGTLCNVANTAKYSRRLLGTYVIPTLLKNTMLYNFTLKRFLCGPEHFCVNGVPLFADIDDDLMVVPPEMLLKLPIRRARQLSGNMMSIPVVGSVLGMLLLCTMPQERADL